MPWLAFDLGPDSKRGSLPMQGSWIVYGVALLPSLVMLAIFASIAWGRRG